MQDTSSDGGRQKRSNAGRGEQMITAGMKWIIIGAGILVIALVLTIVLARVLRRREKELKDRIYREYND